jgi:hypothetical protein
MRRRSQMTRLVYFVIAVDLDDKSVSVDDETFTARFSKSEQVWDTELSEWRPYTEENVMGTPEEYDLAVDILNEHLNN